MELKSVDNPQIRRSPFESESAEPAQPRIVTEAGRGQAPGDRSLAAEHFLVRGTRPEPLRRPTSTIFESILGDVDRRKPILETHLTPWRMICSLECVGKFGSTIGTGWFAGPRTLITAGHCVFNPVDLGGWAIEIRIIPGRNGPAVPPFGKVTSKSFSTTDRWQQAQDPDFDYAAIHLSSDLGAQTGHFAVGVLPDAELRDRLVNVSGYPLTPGAGSQQYFHANRVTAVTPRRAFYDIDTIGGQSGSPVWAYFDDAPEVPVAIGIHAYGVGGVPGGLNVIANSGPRIIPESLEVIQTWINKGNGV
jgi:glutamyl endopeptidase